MIATAARKGGAARTFDAVVRSGASPEKCLLAAVVQNAVDARDLDALGKCLPIIEVLCPAGWEPEAVHAALLRLATQNIKPQAGFWQQLGLFGNGESL